MFNPFDWYWRDDDGRIYSSKRRTVVSKNDKEFEAFLAGNGFVTRWPTDANGRQTDAALAEVLAPYGLAVGLPTLDQVKDELRAKIDAAAEVERLKYITPGVGQAMTYQRKADEASRFLAASNPKADDFPLLSAEIGVTAETLHGVAEAVSSAFNQWLFIGGQIETVRLKAKAAVEAAETEEAAHAIARNIAWPIV